MGDKVQQICDFCSEPNHNKNNCLKKKTYPGTRYCYYCDEPNHYQAKCLQRIKDKKPCMDDIGMEYWPNGEEDQDANWWKPNQEKEYVWQPNTLLQNVEKEYLWIPDLQPEYLETQNCNYYRHPAHHQDECPAKMTGCSYCYDNDHFQEECHLQVKDNEPCLNMDGQEYWPDPPQQLQQSLKIQLGPKQKNLETDSRQDYLDIVYTGLTQEEDLETINSDPKQKNLEIVQTVSIQQDIETSSTENTEKDISFKFFSSIVNFFILLHVCPLTNILLIIMFFLKKHNSKTKNPKKGEWCRDTPSRIIAKVVMWTYSGCVHLLYRACTISISATVHLHYYASFRTSKVLYNSTKRKQESFPSIAKQEGFLTITKQEKLIISRHIKLYKTPLCSPIGRNHFQSKLLDSSKNHFANHKPPERKGEVSDHSFVFLNWIYWIQSLTNHNTSYVCLHLPTYKQISFQLLCKVRQTQADQPPKFGPKGLLVDPTFEYKYECSCHFNFSIIST